MGSPTGTRLFAIEAENSADARRLEAGLECTLRDSLGPVSLGLFILMVVLVISHPLFLPPEIAPALMASAAICASYFLTVYLLVRYRRVPERAGNPVGLIGVVMLSLNSLLHLYLSANPAQTTNMALVLIGVGIFFLAPLWYGVAMILAAGGWWLTSWVLGQDAAWFHYNFLMVMAGLLSFMAFYLRRHALLRLEQIRLQDERQQQLLEESARQAQENLLALRQAKEAAETANRAKTTFLTMMSHDLRTPLTVILGYSEMLHAQAEFSGDEQIASRMAQVESAGKHLLSMLNDILDYARLDSEQLQANPEPVQPALLVAQVADAMTRKIEKRGNRLELAVAADLGEMVTDPQRLYQVLSNLLGYAARTTENGVVRLAAQQELDPSGRAWISFEVSDNGPGLSAGEMAGLFEPFPSGDLREVLHANQPEQSQISVGLAISQRLCRLLGGELTVRSTPGMGTRFTARLPVDVGQG